MRNNAKRLADKFEAARSQLTRYKDAAQNAFGQFMQYPKKLGRHDRQVIKEIGHVPAWQVAGPVTQLVYTKVVSDWTVKENQRNLRSWQAIVDARLADNRPAPASAFASCIQNSDQIDSWKTQIGIAERQTAASNALLTGVLIGIAI